jgi:hypothetical protein
MIALRLLITVPFPPSTGIFLTRAREYRKCDDEK